MSKDETKPAHPVVLIADDEEDVRCVAEEVLRHLGYDVRTAADGVEALEQIERHPEIRLVLLDLTMPRLSGEETFAELHRRRPDIAVVVTSGHDEQETMRRFEGKGLAGFLQKPFRLEHVDAKVRAVLAASAGAKPSVAESPRGT